MATENQMPISNTPSLLRMMKVFIIFAITGLALPVAAADDNQPANSTGATATDQAVQQKDVMEEVTVIGQKQIFTLRKQIIQAEDHAFEIFNILNDDDEYDIHCEMVARTGTRIRKRMCLPNFYREATAAEAQEFLGYVGVTTYIPVAPSLQNVIAYKFPIFKSKVKKMALENPNMFDALKKLIELNQELKETRDVYYHGNQDK